MNVRLLPRPRGRRPVLWRAAPAALVLSLWTSAAHAHATGGVLGGFADGFAHPLLGLDHLVAMVAVGLWGAFLGPPALWMLPIVFPLIMAFGGALGILGVPLPASEIGIGVSAVVLTARWPAGRLTVRTAGVVIAAAGVVTLSGWA